MAPPDPENGSSNMGSHRIIEYLELEGTCKDHRVQLSREQGHGTGGSSLLQDRRHYFPFGCNLLSELKK